jgi:1-acyl-sn-glycerol-3-phosphate acyltransferase
LAEPTARGAAAGRRFGRVLAPTLYSVRRDGIALVPTEGPLVVVSNHSGFLDGPLIFCTFPRPVHFLVKRAYFESPFGPMLRRVGQIPIEQQTGDREALTAARQVLRRGGVVGVFPEGTRGAGAVEQAQQGAAYLALQNHAAVLPVACLGTRASGAGRDAWPRLCNRLEVVLGAPFQLEDAQGGPGRDRLRRATERLRLGLAAHVHAAAERSGIALPGDAPPPSSRI